MTGLNVSVKICGLKERVHVACAVAEGADFIGFNFHPKSPRFVGIQETKELSNLVGGACRSVALFVDPHNQDLDAVIDFVDIIQLHGRESPERVADVQARTGKPVIKAVPLARPEDVATARQFEKIANFLLFDAKPSKPGDLEGGGGIPFDWRLLEGQRFNVPWFLAGGLTPDTVSAAISQTGALMVDVSSGVESRRGEKDEDKIRAFIRAVKQ